ncbi:ribonuclease HII [Vulcanococcus sp.]|jgi:ribonuclease HII|uniref:ribonuclease HII n=1 Tax=Vulcanococcus sp. TaxID=2856995 RepID=UPI003C019EE9
MANPVAVAAGPRPPTDLDGALTLRVAGIDEVGRGCWYGPVFAGAVVLDALSQQRLAAAGLTDSKALSAKRRAQLVPLIQQHAQAWALGQASAREIDELGIRTATELAMLRALQRLEGEPPQLVLVDGVLPLRLWHGEQRCVVRGDAEHQEIAAASVLAKQARDALIQRLARLHPGYGLERHAGYGTAVHRAAVLRDGPTVLHRRSFLRKLLAA